MSVLLAGKSDCPEFWFDVANPERCDVCERTSFVCLMADNSKGKHAANAVCIRCVLDGLVAVSEVLDTADASQLLAAIQVRGRL